MAKLKFYNNRIWIREPEEGSIPDDVCIGFYSADGLTIDEATKFHNALSEVLNKAMQKSKRVTYVGKIMRGQNAR